MIFDHVSVLLAFAMVMFITENVEYGDMYILVNISKYIPADSVHTIDVPLLLTVNVFLLQ